MKHLIPLAMALLMAAPATAQQVVVPNDRVTKIEAGCQVQGLDPNGDGFLALRAGPGTDYSQIGSLQNGDVAYLASQSKRGRWHYVENGAISGKEARFRGWIYDAWCMYFP